MVAIPQVRTRLDNLGLLVLKVAAFGLMVLDHLDTMIYGGSLGMHGTLGRVVMPVFALVLGVNLARHDDWQGLLRRTAPRLALIGVVATPVYAMLMGWNHYNVLFTLAAGVVAVAFVQRNWWLAATAVIFAAGWSVDYGSLGIVSVVGAWMICRLGLPVVAAAAWAAVAVVPVNGSLWSLLAIPLVLIASDLRGDAPRFAWLFWVGYPLHLLGILFLTFALQQ